MAEDTINARTVDICILCWEVIIKQGLKPTMKTRSMRFFTRKLKKMPLPDRQLTSVLCIP